MGKNSKYGLGIFGLSLGGRRFKFDKWQKSDMFSVLQELEDKHCSMYLDEDTQYITCDSLYLINEIRSKLKEDSNREIEIHVLTDKTYTRLFDIVLHIDSDKPTCIIKLGEEDFDFDLFFGDNYITLQSVLKTLRCSGGKDTDICYKLFKNQGESEIIYRKNKRARATCDALMGEIVYKIKLKEV